MDQNWIIKNGGQSESAYYGGDDDKEADYMKKETNQQKPKMNNALNDEVTAAYQNVTNEQTGQPTPQPKDYEEIEY